VRVPLAFVGTARGRAQPGRPPGEVTRELEISADPANIPDRIDVDVSALTIGHPLHVRDVAVPQGVTVLTDAGATVVQVSPPRARRRAPRKRRPLRPSPRCCARRSPTPNGFLGPCPALP
jgi:hypothetical protein